MKGKGSPSRRSRISFAVDREEIDINSDWVSAVLHSPAERDSAPGPHTSGPHGADSATEANITTAALSTTDGGDVSVAQQATVVFNDTVAKTSPGTIITTARQEDTGAQFATVELPGPPAISRQYRPRRIRSIVDGLTPGQFTVYSLMWQKGAGDEGQGRLYGGGYRSLCDLAGMSKRGIQNVVVDLQRKEVISVHQAPGYHRSQFSVYRVLAEDEVLALWRQRGYIYAIGKGKALANTTTVVEKQKREPPRPMPRPAQWHPDQ